MKKQALGLLAGLALLLVTALPASAQLWFFPDYAVPSAIDGPSTWIAGSYGRGLNDASGKLDAIGAFAGRTGESASFMGGLAIVTGGASDEITAGGSIGFDIMQGESATIGLQGGFGWMSPDGGTLLRFPIGVAIKGAAQSPEALIVPWIMPRLNITRVSSDLFGSDTETDFGASAGVSFTFNGGFGVHTALDILLGTGAESWLFGMGGHYILGGGG